MAPTRPADEVRFLALGDSYTIGEGVDAGERWPVVLAAALRAEGLAVEEPTIVATTGWTTDELDSAIDEAERAGDVTGRYGLVTLLIGVNNQYRGRSVDEYRTEFRALLARAIAFAGAQPGRVVVLSIPDWGATPFAREMAATEPRRAANVVAGEIDAFNAVAREETAGAGARWVDVTPLSRAHPEELAPDGLHPSAAQYARWAEAALPAARDAIRTAAAGRRY
jgi:lysophospholipase L1-like esterase